MKKHTTLREALKALLDDIGYYKTDGLDTMWCSIKGETLRKAHKALSEPPSNFENVESGDEAYEAYCNETGWRGNVYRDVLHWLFLPQKSGGESRSSAKVVEPPDGTEVWLVYRDADGDGLVVYKEFTDDGTVLFNAGPRMVAIKLYEDHVADGNTGSGYISPVTWFYTEEEANEYARKHAEEKDCVESIHMV